MSQAYSDPSRASDPSALPDLSIVWFGSDDAPIYDDNGRPVEPGEGERTAADAGYYVCFCFPGCMPDSDWSGPYATEEKAIEDMRRLHIGD